MGDRHRRISSCHLRSRRSCARSLAPEPDRRFPTLRRVLDGLKEHEKNLARAEKEVEKLREDLRKEEAYSSRYKQQRDDVEKKFAEAQRQVEMLLEQRGQAAQEAARLQALLEEKTQQIGTLDKAMEDLKRTKNRDCCTE